MHILPKENTNDTRTQEGRKENIYLKCPTINEVQRGCVVGSHYEFEPFC